VTLEQISWLATALGAPTAIGALVFAGLQLRRTFLIERGRFLLELERMSATYDKTHIRLRPGGDWSDRVTGPASAQEWADLEDYMGFFEHCELLIKAGILEQNHFNRLFGYRLRNIVANETRVEAKLVKEGSDWTDFRSLARRINITLPSVKKG
jgi:hypothetical protein